MRATVREAIYTILDQTISEFVIDELVNSKAILTAAPRGYLRRGK